jgi:protein Mpv17
MKELKQKGWRLYVAEWVVWPPAQVINFYLLPTRFRVLYDNTVSLGYDIYTSYVAHEIPLEDEVDENIK